MSSTPTNTELKEMTEGERLIYLITVMDSNCKAVEQLTKNNSKEHADIQTYITSVDQELFSQIDDLKKEKVSNKLFYSTISVILAVILAFAGTLYYSGKDITGNSTRIINIERQVFKTTDDKKASKIFNIYPINTSSIED